MILKNGNEQKAKSFFVSRQCIKGGFFVIWLFTLAVVPTTSFAKDSDQKLKFSTAFDFSSGSYGLAKDTEILYVPFSVKYEAFPWVVKATVPYIRIKGSRGVVGADGAIVIDKSGNKTRTDEGLGDILVSASYALDNVLDTSLLLDLTSKVKIGTADEKKALGTGKNDYSLQLDVAKKYGNKTPFSTLGYKVMGDPDGIELNNIWYGSIGVDYKIDSKLSSGVSYNFKEATTSASEAPKEGVAYLNWKLNSTASIMGYGVAGFSDGSPQTGVGVQVSIKQ